MMRTGERLDHMLEKAEIVARPRAAGVDQRRATAASQSQGIDAQRGAAPIDVGMQIDQARRHDQAR